jgi:predicted cupin superfamily sugar epimerase
VKPDEIIAALGLEKHPEGGWYRETWRDAPADGSRGVGTAIYYFLTRGQRSHWHRIDAVEHWHYHAGDPIELKIHHDGKTETHLLGPDFANGHEPQIMVPPGAWQAAVSTGEWTLVGCTVAPAFSFEKFELAPEGWEP